VKTWTETILDVMLILVCGVLVAFIGLAALQGCMRGDSLAPLAATACAEQRAIAFATIDEYAARIPTLSARISEAQGTAEALLATVEAQTPCPSATPPYPTPIATPTPPPVIGLCQLCTLGGRECPAGFSCAYCPQLGYRCVDPVLVNGSCNTCRLAESSVPIPWLPDWSAIGLCTHYTDGTTASGEPFRADGMACAVDRSLWAMLQGLTLKVTRKDTGASLNVYVNDVGRLYDSGWWAWGVRRVGRYDVARYWPAQEGIGYQVVIDLPEGTAAGFAPDTALVSVEVCGGGTMSAQEYMSYVARCPKCGAVRIAVVDAPSHPRDIAKEVARAIRDGYLIERVTCEWVRTMANFHCTCKDVQAPLPGVDGGEVVQ